MPWAPATPVLLKCAPGRLCQRQYPGHAHGCPNYGHRATCPPKATRWTPQDLAAYEWYVVWVVFEFGEHVARMKDQHPDWSQRQCECCLYWQGTARSRLRAAVDEFLTGLYAAPHTTGRIIETMDIMEYYVPEAHGVDVTATMARLGVVLEWPPVVVTHHVAVVRVERAV